MSRKRCKATDRGDATAPIIVDDLVEPDAHSLGRRARLIPKGEQVVHKRMATAAELCEEAERIALQAWIEASPYRWKSYRETMLDAAVRQEARRKAEENLTWRDKDAWVRAALGVAEQRVMRAIEGGL